MTETTQAATQSRPSAWAPFQHRAFAVLWFATLVSNIGTWMHDVGAGWLMTELSPSPLVVAAVQAATTLPIFLFALPAGALADLVDKRRLLIIINIFLGAVAATLALIVTSGTVTPTLLLVITVLMGTGAAFMAPAWQAIVPQLVPRDQLAAAVGLNSMGINISRAIGPALAGVLIVQYGPALPFVINALSVVGILAALLWWREPDNKKSTLPPETILQAMIAGLRYTANSAAMKNTLLRAAAFFIFASAFWALLPLIVRTVIGGGAGLYGFVLTSLGAGAVLGAVLLPRIKERLGADATVSAGTIGLAVVMVTLALLPNNMVALAGAFVAGISWICVLSTVNVSAQTSLPDWVRARGLSVYMMVFFGSMTIGSLLWGHIASTTGIPTALVIAAAGAVSTILFTRGIKLNQGAGVDFSPSMHWPQPVVSLEQERDRGPVMIQIAYDIAAEDRAAFTVLMRDLEAARRRNGGYQWSLMQDTDTPTRHVETWYEASWLQHMRHHERVSGSDKLLQDKVAALHRGAAGPVVHHYISSR